jgi:hypothetical protein
MIRYIVKNEGRVRVRIFNLLGREVQVLINEVKPNGSYEIIWYGKDRVGSTVTSGIYF